MKHYSISIISHNLHSFFRLQKKSRELDLLKSCDVQMLNDVDSNRFLKSVAMS